MNIIDEYEQKPLTELFDNAEYAINQLCEKGFRGFTMSIPVQVTDTDIVLSVAIKMARQRTTDLEAQLAEAQRQNELPSSLLDLIRFMCDVWDKTQEWAINKAGADAFMSYPMIQGTRNQMDLKKIAAQSYESENIREAVKWMIRQAAIDGGARVDEDGGALEKQ